MAWKVVGWVLGTLIGTALVVACWPQLFGLAQAPIIAQVVSMRVGVIVIALIGALVALGVLVWSRAKVFGAVCLVFLLIFSAVSFGIHANRGLDETPTTATAEDVTVLTWNTLGDVPGADAIAEAILQTGADIVTLPETTIEMGTAVALLLREAGTPFWALTTDFNSSDYGALNTTLLVSAALGSYQALPSNEVGQTATLPTVVAVPEDGSGPVVVATHPVAPIPGQMHNWRTDLDFVAGLCDRYDSIIIGGDFNSTVDHWAGLGVQDGDLGSCVDGASNSGSGAVGTWPTWAPPWLGTQIDHVIASQDWTPIDSHVVTGFDDAGSDHRPVVVVLRQQ